MKRGSKVPATSALFFLETRSRCPANAHEHSVVKNTIRYDYLDCYWVPLLPPTSSKEVVAWHVGTFLLESKTGQDYCRVIYFGFVANHFGFSVLAWRVDVSQ